MLYSYKIENKEKTIGSVFHVVCKKGLAFADRGFQKRLSGRTTMVSKGQKFGRGDSCSARARHHAWKRERDHTGHTRVPIAGGQGDLGDECR